MSSSELTDNDLTFTADGIISAASNLTLQNSTGTPFIWPTTDPAVNGYVLSSTTGGTMSWVAQSGGGSSGALGAIQLSDGSGGFDGDTSLLLFDDFTTPGDSRFVTATSGSTITPYTFLSGTQNLYIELRNNVNANDESILVINNNTLGVSQGSVLFNKGSSNIQEAIIRSTQFTNRFQIGTSTTSGNQLPFNMSSDNGLFITDTSGNIIIDAIDSILRFTTSNDLEFVIGSTVYVWPSSPGSVGDILRIQSILGSTVTLHWAV